VRRGGQRTQRSVGERQRLPQSLSAVHSQFTGSSTQMQCDGGTFTEASENIVSREG
jgi:hypothetical protein